MAQQQSSIRKQYQSASVESSRVRRIAHRAVSDWANWRHSGNRDKPDEATDTKVLSPLWAATGLFLQIIDLGQVAAWRISGDTTVNKASPDLQVKNVFAPGAYLMFGITRSIPITLGFGGSYAPDFRTINGSTGATVHRVNTVRLNMVFALDLTLFP